MMSKDEILNSFFTRSFESEYNERLMLRDYILPSEEIHKYIRYLLEIPLFDFVDGIVSNYSVNHFSTKNIPQFSSFYNATDGICNILKENGDEGYKFVEMGVFLRPNNVVRNSRADLKYGENHCKTASDFGLVQIRVGNICYLSCFGKVFNDLTEVEKQRFLSRFVLRNNFINWVIYRASYRVVLLEQEMGILKPSTIKRRKPNVIYYLNLLKEQNDYRIDKILSNIR